MINCIPEEGCVSFDFTTAPSSLSFFKTIVSQGVTKRMRWEDGKKEDLRWTRCGKGHIHSRWFSPNQKLRIPKPDLKFNKPFSRQTFWLVTVRNRGITHNSHMPLSCSIVPVSHTSKHNASTITLKQLHSDVLNRIYCTCANLQCNNSAKKFIT